MTNHIKLAESCGIYLYLIDSFEYISLFNSPYYAHNHGIAIDIYLGPGKFGAEAPCPTPGKVINIQKVKAPIRKNFNAEETDYLIILQSEENPRQLIKMLHINPKVKVGENLEVGDCLGTLIRSGFFNFWTDPHIHLEIRNPGDPIRAKGSKPIRLLSLKRESCSEPNNSFKCKVINVRTDYTMVEPSRKVTIKIGKFYGFAIKINNEIGILDCGLPHYGFGGVLLENNNFELGQKVYLGDLPIGNTFEKKQNIAAIKLNPISIICEGIDLRGLSHYINLKNPLIKLITKKREKLNLSEGEEILITIKSHEEE
ncbi:MAG: hypothetical protein ACUVXA_13995 [Candidatus Jordarchaeum sp.]|uniref:hypothetical protein n=1 Tax=Candidatus Jordarchaeum sp. TaxID=2823881 RepID=UPI00404977FD